MRKPVRKLPEVPDVRKELRALTKGIERLRGEMKLDLTTIKDRIRETLEKPVLK